MMVDDLRMSKAIAFYMHISGTNKNVVHHLC